eukprot:scaffold7153_cov115-Isochrysis_galbana.AAC.1
MTRTDFIIPRVIPPTRVIRTTPNPHGPVPPHLHRWAGGVRLGLPVQGERGLGAWGGPGLLRPVRHAGATAGSSAARRS